MHNYVISDIHGNSERLSLLLNLLKNKHADGDFMLHIIGDIFDRGDSSFKVYELLMKNQKNINLLFGNHEQLFMDFMEFPKENYINWQTNFAFPTIRSFVDEYLASLFLDEHIFNERKLRNMYLDAYRETQDKLRQIFGNSDTNSPQVYIDEFKGTFSSRDPRIISSYIKQGISKILPRLPIKNRGLVENITYLMMLDKFCDIYCNFASLKTYQIIDDKYLLVHSGYVSKNKKENIDDNINEAYYLDCETKEDLPLQNFYPMVWSRRYDITQERNVAPSERFDGLIVVFGHTVTSKFKNNDSLAPIITYDEQNKIASIGIDGKNFDKLSGQMNCVCLDDLSMILISGSNKVHKTDPSTKSLTIKVVESIQNNKTELSSNQMD